MNEELFTLTVKKRTRTTRKKVTESILTLESLIENDGQYDEMVKVEFPDGRFTQVYKKFRITKVDELLKQFSQFVLDYSSKIEEIKEERVIDYLNLHILISFSTLSNGLPDSFEERVLLFEKLLDSKLAEQVFDAFEWDQVAYVYQRMNKKIGQHLDLLSRGNMTNEIA